MNATSSSAVLQVQQQRRALAVDMVVAQGRSQAEVARLVRASEASLSRWVAAYRAGGAAALATKPRSGRPPKLSRAAFAAVPDLLARGACAFGFESDVWTAPRVAALLQRAFGVTYDLAHVGRLLRRAGWSWQKPQRVAKERDAAAVATWAATTWPALKKSRGARHDARLHR